MHRRTFLTTLTSGIAGSAIAPRWALAQDEIKTALNGPVGLQLWSVREYLPKDLPGTLAKVRGLGFREVEGAGLWGKSVSELRRALDAAGLRCQSAHMQFERLRDDLGGALAEAKALGARSVVCPWIPHQKTFTRDDALKAAEAFNRFGSEAAKADLTFGYHCHGYDFVPSPEGTLFETIATNTEPSRVRFQIDVFHTYHGGADPVRLIERHKSRVTSLHLKDLRKGVVVKVGTATGEPDEDVPVGTGQIDMRAVLRAAMMAGTALYYLEDESADPWGHIPQSLTFLKSFKP
ncbi:MAG: sugar phosphate isomerase/epimerase [Vicinamibacterales bacterium]